MTMITPSYLGETIEYSSLHACRSTLEDPRDPSRPRHKAKNIIAHILEAMNFGTAKSITHRDSEKYTIRDRLVSGWTCNIND